MPNPTFQSYLASGSKIASEIVNELPPEQHIKYHEAMATLARLACGSSGEKVAMMIAAYEHVKELDQRCTER